MTTLRRVLQASEQLAAAASGASSPRSTSAASSPRSSSSRSTSAAAAPLPPVVEAPPPSPAPPVVVPDPPPPVDAAASGDQLLDLEPLKKQNITWVQCDTCEKWRKLPPNMEEQLPDVWTCNMNKWAPNGGSCDDPEDAEDAAAPLLVVGEDAATSSSTSGTPALEDGGKPTPSPAPLQQPAAAAAAAPSARERRAAAAAPVAAPLVYAPLLPPGINLYGQAFQVPVGGKHARIVSYRDLIASHYRNNKTFNPHYDHICDVRYAPFSGYTSPTVHLEPNFALSQPPAAIFPVRGTPELKLPPKKRHRQPPPSSST